MLGELVGPPWFKAASEIAHRHQLGATFVSVLVEEVADAIHKVELVLIPAITVIKLPEGS